ncbi:MAG: TRAM domain-containing protein, partial [Halolamina sp.]
GDRGGAEWCNHYDMPIDDLKEQPVKPGEEIVVDVTDIHESGAGVGRTEDGFIVLIDGLLPECRAKVRIDQVMSNHAKAVKVVEKMPLEEEEDVDGEAGPGNDGVEPADNDGRPDRTDRERLGSRDNFWGGDGV